MFSLLGLSSYGSLPCAARQVPNVLGEDQGAAAQHLRQVPQPLSRGAAAVSRRKNESSVLCLILRLFFCFTSFFSFLRLHTSCCLLLLPACFFLSFSSLLPLLLTLLSLVRIAQITEVLRTHSAYLDAEIQQRAVEYMNISQKPQLLVGNFFFCLFCFEIAEEMEEEEKRTVEVHEEEK